jgi:hypothetical protein
VRHVHEVKWVGGVVHFVVAQRHQQAVCDELNVLAHELGVHANEANRESIQRDSQREMSKMKVMTNQ